MTGMVVLAVDDERPALDDLAYLLHADDHVETVLTASSATEAMRILTGPGHAQPVDAAFLDIRMPGVDGMELARACGRLVAPPAVVFVTAHEDRAVEAFALGAVDYLLKPLHSARLGTTLGRIAAAMATSEPVEETLAIELAGETTQVTRGSVRFVEAQGDYVRLHTAADNHLVRMPLGELEERWRESGFLRIHRSFLVARGQITALSKSSTGHVVHVNIGGAEVALPVSRRHLPEVRAQLRGDWTG